jgi:hypothetical protein
MVARFGRTAIKNDRPERRNGGPITATPIPDRGGPITHKDKTIAPKDNIHDLDPRMEWRLSNGKGGYRRGHVGDVKVSVMALLRRVFASLAIAAAGVLIASILIPPVADAWMSRGTAQSPKPSALPCEKQQWPNADRVCLTWTAPREVGSADGRQP